MSTPLPPRQADEAFIRLIERFENTRGESTEANLFRCVHTRFDDECWELKKKVKSIEDEQELFSEKSVLEFKKIWLKLKEIESRVPGPVTPSPQPVPPPQTPTKPPPVEPPAGDDKPQTPTPEPAPEPAPEPPAKEPVVKEPAVKKLKVSRK